jgi:DNA-binding NarL/FixJ family response regulator
MTQTIRVLLVDDQPTIRQGLRLRLSCEPDLEIVGEAEDGYSAVEAAVALGPDVIVLDISMPGMDGFTAAQEIRAASEARIVMLSLRDDDSSRCRAEMSGAHAFVSKHEPTDRLVETIRDIATRIPDPGQITNGGP